MDVAEMMDAARRRLAELPRERLGELVVPRRILGIARPPRIEPRGTAWHLGALLLTDDEVLATGDILRAREDVRRGFTAESQRERAALAAAARRGGFAEGEPVHIGWERLDPAALARGEASGPLAMLGSVPGIRWSRTGALVPLEGYLDDRIALLLAPPD
nr:glutaminase [Microbacterium bovistercoris]